MKSGIELIADERQRQIESEGWSAKHDSCWVKGQLALAAICYASPVPIYTNKTDRLFREVVFSDPWPFDSTWDKRDKHDRIRQLTIAGALIAAEIDRLTNVELNKKKLLRIVNEYSE